MVAKDFQGLERISAKSRVGSSDLGCVFFVSTRVAVLAAAFMMVRSKSGESFPPEMVRANPS